MRSALCLQVISIRKPRENAHGFGSSEAGLGQIVQSRGLRSGRQQAFLRERPDDFALAILHSAKS